MNKEISLKKFIIILCILLSILSITLFFSLRQTKPFCSVSSSECKKATCEICKLEENQQKCNGCSLYNKDHNRIWTGDCIYKK